MKQQLCCWHEEAALEACSSTLRNWCWLVAVEDSCLHSVRFSSAVCVCVAWLGSTLRMAAVRGRASLHSGVPCAEQQPMNCTLMTSASGSLPVQSAASRWAGSEGPAGATGRSAGTGSAAHCKCSPMVPSAFLEKRGSVCNAGTPTSVCSTGAVHQPSTRSSDAAKHRECVSVSQAQEAVNQPSS